MSRLTKSEIITAFNKTKNLAQQEFESNNFQISLDYIKTAAELAYMFNWIYTDDDLENLLREISSKVVSKKEFIPRKGRVVFYDVFCLENRGLTQQYVRALMSWDVEILYVYEGNDLSIGNKIIEELNAYHKAEVFYIEESINSLCKIQRLYDVIVNFSPEKALLHLAPWSVIAVCIWNALNEVVRYQINLTDHAFWLGAKCIDYSLEFRDYGMTVSIEKRGLAENMLLFQPYYPIMDCYPYIGLPVEIPADAIKIFTGGAYYKMYGESDVFFKILEFLIGVNSKVVILIAGHGLEKPLTDFIKSFNFESKVFLLGSRPDITHVFQNSQLYLTTFPITGGLMGQYAAALGVPILSYSSPDFPGNFTEGFIDWKKGLDFRLTHTSIESFMKEALKLIEDENYRHHRGSVLKGLVITETEFSSRFIHQLNSHKLSVPFIRVNINYDSFTNLYLEMENKYLKSFDHFVVSRFKLLTLFLFPKVFFRFIVSKRMCESLLSLFKRLILN